MASSEYVLAPFPGKSVCFFGGGCGVLSLSSHSPHAVSRPHLVALLCCVHLVLECVVCFAVHFSHCYEVCTGFIRATGSRPFPGNALSVAFLDVLCVTALRARCMSALGCSGSGVCCVHLPLKCGCVFAVHFSRNVDTTQIAARSVYSVTHSCLRIFGERLVTSGPGT